MKKDRGKLLTTVLIILSVGTLYGFFNIVSKDFRDYADYYNVSELWFKTYFWFSWILRLIVVIGLWLWKKWAVYLNIVIPIMGVFIQTFLLKLPGIEWYKFLFFQLLPLILVMVFFLWPVSRKWKYFE